MLLRKLLTALSAIERPDLFVNRRHVLLQMIFARKSVLANVALPVASLFFLRFSVFSECDGSDGDAAHAAVPGDGVTERDAAVLVFAVKRRRVELVLLLRAAGDLVHGRDVVLKGGDARENLETNKIVIEALNR